MQLKNKKKRYKILHAPINIANQPSHITKIEKEKGYVSDFIVNYGHAFGYTADIIISKHQDFTLKNTLKRFYYSFSSIFKYNIFNYYFGRTLFNWDDFLGPRNWLWFLDLKIAKFLGKRVLMTMQGCDIRIAEETERRYEISACHVDKCPRYKVCRDTEDTQRRWLIDKILPYVDHVFFLNPDLGYYLDPNKSSFLPYASVDVEKIEVTLPACSGKIKILHAPSVPQLKGTPQIMASLKELAKKYDLELILVQNMSHTEALEKYKEADLVIDQIYVGWYGGFAAEVMAMGKPVACYLREQDFHYLPSNLVKDLPIYKIDPLNLTDTLEGVLKDRRNWQKRGKESREFAEKWHSPKMIQEEIERFYT